MQVIILNSGMGKRMGDLTNDKPKCLVKLNTDQTILSRQLDILVDKNIEEIIMTTGPYEDKIKKLIKYRYSNINIKFVNNDIYFKTNYIYSIYLVRNMINSDVILLHGDLVFQKSIFNKLIYSDYENAVLINKIINSPDKDFKGEINNNEIKKISVELNNANSFLLQPFYKFSRSSFEIWLKEISNFVNLNKVNAYAEEALNNLLNEKIDLNYIKYEQEICMEVDNKNDLKKAKMLLKGCKNETD